MPEPSTTLDPCSPDVARRLTVAGLLAVVHQSIEDADIVGRAVDALLQSPGRFAQRCAMALSMRGQTTFAADLLDRHRASYFDDDRQTVTLATALMFGGDPRGRRELERVMAVSLDQAARSAASKLMDMQDRIHANRKS
jgi:hypothetical protein